MITLFSCKRKYTCAAYHSSFILDPTDQDKHFSLFEMDTDTMPKGYSSTRDKHGLSQGPTVRTYNKKHYVIPMILVPPKSKEENPDSLETNATDIDQMEKPPENSGEGK